LKRCLRGGSDDRNQRLGLNWKTYANVSATIFLLVAIGHPLLRLIFGWEVRIGDLGIPQWASLLVLVVSGVLAYSGFNQRRR
jgi:hypothetical protein